MGYPKDLLSSRSVIEHGKYALIAPEGLVNNVIPGFHHCHISILGSPKLGASFVDYHVTMKKEGGNKEGFGGQEEVQTFVYILEGRIK
ncbi:(S)-ureidoglycine aminohydrolase, partial [Escherichia coli]|nr:(S)-ureidoglycine aminohydrolase [Escherichia coli]